VKEFNSRFIGVITEKKPQKNTSLVKLIYILTVQQYFEWVGLTMTYA
jgi:hypothetical protein